MCGILFASRQAAPTQKELFKLVNLVIHHRIFFENEPDFLPRVLTNEGRETILH